MDDESISSKNEDDVDSDTESVESFVLSDDEDECVMKDLSQDLTFEAKTEDYMVEATILFSTTQMENLKEKEEVLVERRKHGYYRSKILIQWLIQKLSRLTSPISRVITLRCYGISGARKNEAINKSVVSYAPKDKTYCTTTSFGNTS